VTELLLRITSYQHVTDTSVQVSQRDYTHKIASITTASWCLNKYISELLIGPHSFTVWKDKNW